MRYKAHRDNDAGFRAVGRARLEKRNAQEQQFGR